MCEKIPYGAEELAGERPSVKHPVRHQIYHPERSPGGACPGPHGNENAPGGIRPAASQLRCWRRTSRLKLTRRLSLRCGAQPSHFAIATNCGTVCLSPSFLSQTKSLQATDIVKHILQSPLGGESTKAPSFSDHILRRRRLYHQSLARLDPMSSDWFPARLPAGLLIGALTALIYCAIH